MTVYLVGAGPGDPGLMSARSLELIAAADVIVYDRLIPDTALDGARAGAELVYAGKEGGGPSVSQDDINGWLVEHGEAGKEVVRLKGGDPFVFGRGGEEAEALREAGLPFEIVPGITAGVAAPAYAGIPVTHRDSASAVAFITGHEDPTKPESALDWAALAAFPGTLVVYMGVRQLAAITEQLIAGGRPGTEPAALVQRGTLPDQRSVAATLDTIADVGREAGIKAPAIAVFGPVAALGANLEWYRRPPLTGRRIAVTRARAQASGLAARLRALGASVVETPAIKIVPLDGPAPDVGRLRPRLLDQPERGAAALSAARRGRTGRPSARRCPRGCDRAGDGAGARRARDHRRRRPGAVRRRGADRGAARTCRWSAS